MDKDYYEAKLREILDRKDINRFQRAEMVHNFTVLALIELAKSSK